MDNYTLDFGRLAFVKTEDLGRRMDFLENRVQDNYKSIYFSAAGGEHIFPFTAAADTHLKFECAMTLDGAADISFWLNGVFLYGTALTAGDKRLTFEARGCEKGDKKLEVHSGAATQNLEVTVSGNNIDYHEYYSSICTAVFGGADYVLAALSGKLTVYKKTGTELTGLNAVFPAVKKCAAAVYNGNFLVFYTVWDNTLFVSRFNPSDLSLSTPQRVAFDVSDFSAAPVGGALLVYLIQNQRLNACIGFEAQNRLCFTHIYGTDIRGASGVSCAFIGGRMYLISARLQSGSKLHIGGKTKIGQAGTLNLALTVQEL